MSGNSSPISAPNVAEAMLNIFDGDEQPFVGKVLLHIHNGQDIRVRPGNTMVDGSG